MENFKKLLDQTRDNNINVIIVLDNLLSSTASIFMEGKLKYMNTYIIPGEYRLESYSGNTGIVFSVSNVIKIDYQNANNCYILIKI